MDWSDIVFKDDVSIVPQVWHTVILKHLGAYECGGGVLSQPERVHFQLRQNRAQVAQPVLVHELKHLAKQLGGVLHQVDAGDRSALVFNHVHEGAGAHAAHRDGIFFLKFGLATQVLFGIAAIDLVARVPIEPARGSQLLHIVHGETGGMPAFGVGVKCPFAYKFPVRRLHDLPADIVVPFGVGFYVGVTVLDPAFVAEQQVTSGLPQQGLGVHTSIRLLLAPLPGGVCHLEPDRISVHLVASDGGEYTFSVAQTLF